ncbi:hypothetical protein P43SY_008973 [Pythium insidiosum]|uniref:Mitofilin n=1 Tax=Pythium insidiosum TaxID=114742 RepID=A0AAD5MI34_PYTIN|nr:hypothetical protein P43SY_008973 [Pythium insidiosum]
MPLKMAELTRYVEELAASNAERDSQIAALETQLRRLARERKATAHASATKDRELERLRAVVAAQAQTIKKLRASLIESSAEARINAVLQEKGENAGSVEVMLVDVGSLASVKAFATVFAQRFDRLDLLVNNAGVGMPVQQKSTDGLAIQFGVNHLGHFYLTTLLFDRLQASKSARIVNISSVLHRRLVDRLWLRSLEVDFSQLATGGSDSPCTRYEKSKLCNLLFTYELDRRLKAANVRNVISVAAHPGTTATAIFDRSIDYYYPSCLQGIAKKLASMCLQSVEMGALPILYAATAEDVQSGEYFGPNGYLNCFGYPAREISSPLSYSESYGQQLWALSEELTKQCFSFNCCVETVMLRANRVTAARRVAGRVRGLSTARPDAKAAAQSAPTNAPPTAAGAAAKPSPAASSSSSGVGFGSLLVLTALSTPAAAAVYLKQNPEWNPEIVRHDANWIKFRDLVLGPDAAKKSSAVAADKQIVLASKPKPVVPKEPSKTPEELSALITKVNPAAAPVKPAAEAPKAPVAAPKKEEPKKKEVAAAPAAVEKKEEKKPKKAEQKEAVVAKPEAEQPKPVAKSEVKAAAPVEEKKPVVVKKVDDAVAKERKEIDKLAGAATPAALGASVDKQIQTTTKEIVSALQAEATAAALDVDKNYLEGLHALDANALAIRVAQLATEMKHRSKWEAVRLMEAMRRMEEDAKKKSEEVLSRQHTLHEELVARELRLQEEVLTRKTREEMDQLKKQYAEDLARNVQEQKTAILKDLQTKFAADKKAIEDRFAQQLRAKSEELQSVLTKERKQRVEELEKYRAELRALNAVLERTSTYEAFSHQVHKASMAALALSDRIEAAAPLRTEIKALREFARNDAFIATALKSLPERVIEEGAPSVSQLQERFKTVKAVGRRAAMIPADSGLLGQLFGGALSYLIISPGGPIQGDDAEAVFSRADYALKAGDIEQAVQEMKGLSGLPAEVSKDWVAAAESRLAVEQTAKVVKAHISLLAASCS